MRLKQRQFCSLDIETTGFDPLTEEILEVGFAFFILDDKGIKITEEWTQVFKPSKEVSPQILALTGITLKELENAPKFSEYRDFLQDKLGQTVILGHNITFDTKFLEGFGIKFSGEIIDTLDLAQWLLPTHHSYNLENLMHTFKISHKEAHRALADSKAALKVFEKFLQIYSGFEAELKKKVFNLLEKSNYTGLEFFKATLPPVSFEDFGLPLKKNNNKIKANFEVKPNTYYNFNLGQDFQELLALGETSSKTLLVVPKAQQALDLYRKKAAQAAVFLPELRFHKKNFSKLAKKKNLTLEETRFVLKILVWSEVNWQTETILDLNLSFFGGQFKNLIVGGEIEENKTAQTVVCDMATFIYLSENRLFKNRAVIICGLSELETAISSNIGSKASWGYLNYLLKSFYNPEIFSGEEKYKHTVEEALSASDLFFGLVNALLQSESPPGFVTYKISEDTLNSQEYQKIKAAAENFVAKLTKANESLNSQSIKKFIEDLSSFFQTEDNRVKWIELSEKRCSFLSMPINITSLVQNLITHFKQVSLADSLDSRVLPQFFLRRLGLTDYVIKNAQDLGTKAGLKQGDLFAGLKKVFGIRTTQVNFHYLSHAGKAEEFLELLEKDSCFPSAILFASSVQVKEFHEANFTSLKAKAQVLAQSAYGGSNKILRNFSINPKSLLLATDKFILKALSSQGAVEQVTKLPVKILVLGRLSFDQFTHPYQEAVSKSYDNAFMDYSLPRALFNMHNLVKFFYTDSLEHVYIFDPKLSKDYAKVFKEYYNIVPGAVVS